MTDAATHPARKPGLLGICAAIADDFGFNPEYLRVLLVAAMLWNAFYVVAAYLALGAVVGVSRLLVPARRRTTPRLRLRARVIALPAAAPPAPAPLAAAPHHPRDYAEAA